MRLEINNYLNLVYFFYEKFKYEGKPKHNTLKFVMSSQASIFPELKSQNNNIEHVICSDDYGFCISSKF